LKRVFSVKSLASVLNIKSVSIPILATAIGAFANKAPWLYISPAAGLAVGIAGSIHETRIKQSEKLASSPYSYLYFMNRDMTKHGLHYWSRRLDTKAFEWIVDREGGSDQYPLARTLDYAINDFLYD
jgi:hypothetical protein